MSSISDTLFGGAVGGFVGQVFLKILEEIYKQWRKKRDFSREVLNLDIQNLKNFIQQIIEELKNEGISYWANSLPNPDNKNTERECRIQALFNTLNKNLFSLMEKAEISRQDKEHITRQLQHLNTVLTGGQFASVTKRKPDRAKATQIALYADELALMKNNIIQKKPSFT